MGLRSAGRGVIWKKKIILEENGPKKLELFKMIPY